MIKGWRQPVRPAAGPLVHPDNIHASRNSLPRDSHHVLRFAGTFKAVDYDHGERRLPFRLPMAVAEDANTWLNFDQPLFGRGQREPAGQKKARDGLNMPARKKSPRTKGTSFARGTGILCNHWRNCIRNHLYSVSVGVLRATSPPHCQSENSERYEGYWSRRSK